jgi:hypothetical protein
MAGDEASMVSVDEGASAEGAVQANIPAGTHVEYCDPKDYAVHPVSGEGVEQSPEQPPQLTAEELQRIPPELRPDAAGNPPVITEKLLRQLRNRYFTVKHVVLTNCNHRLDMINQPKNNCENCWFQWFNTHPQLVETTDQFFRTHGKGPLIGMRGEKYCKMFVRYMATIIHFMNEEKAKKEAQEKVNESASESQSIGNTVSPAVSQEGEVAASSSSVVEG